jgi:hypothetical protein
VVSCCASACACVSLRMSTWSEDCQDLHGLSKSSGSAAISMVLRNSLGQLSRMISTSRSVRLLNTEFFFRKLEVEKKASCGGCRTSGNSHSLTNSILQQLGNKIKILSKTSLFETPFYYHDTNSIPMRPRASYVTTRPGDCYFYPRNIAPTLIYKPLSSLASSINNKQLTQC